MLKTVLKLAVFLFLRSKAKNVKTTTNDNLSAVKHNIIHMAEMRAVVFKQNFNNELKRLGTSVIGFMLMLLAAICSGLIGLMWLFAIAWNSPDRNVILGIAFILPLLVCVGIFAYLRYSWKKEPLFEQAITQIATDWRLFKHGMKHVNEDIHH
jgi:uncharacterized membrane protein YqjE